MATNEILKFAGAAANIMSQINYATQADDGVTSGKANGSLHNKLFRQASLLAAGLAQFIADNQDNNIVDTLTAQQIADYLQTAIASLQVVVPDWSTTVKGKGRLATQAEAQGWGDNTVALTPSSLNAAFKGVNQVLAALGRQNLPGGKQERWGMITSIDNSSTGTTVTFAPAFPNACVNVQLTMIRPDAGGLSQSVSLITRSRTAFTARYGGSAGYNCDWYAIGY